MTEGDDVVVSLADELVQLIHQWVALANGDDPATRESARKHLREVAEAAIATRVRPITSSLAGTKSGKSKAGAAKSKQAKLIKAFKTLTATGDREATEAIEEMVKMGLAARSTIYRHLSPELERLGHARKTRKAPGAK